MVGTTGVAVIPGGQTSATAIETLVSDSSATSYTWTVSSFATDRNVDRSEVHG